MKQIRTCTRAALMVAGVVGVAVTLAGPTASTASSPAPADPRPDALSLSTGPGTIGLNKSAAASGERVWIRGERWKAGRTLTMLLCDTGPTTGANCTRAGLPATAIADQNGKVHATVTIGDSARAGERNLCLNDGGANWACAPFTVVAALAPTDEHTPEPVFNS